MSGVVRAGGTASAGSARKHPTIEVSVPARAGWGGASKRIRQDSSASTASISPGAHARGGGLRAWCRGLTESLLFERAVFVVVIVNAVAMASEDVAASAADMASSRNDVIAWIDGVSLVVFVAEAALKIVGNGFLFPPRRSRRVGAAYASVTTPTGGASRSRADGQHRRRPSTNTYGAYYASGDSDLAEDAVTPLSTARKRTRSDVSKVSEESHARAARSDIPASVAEATGGSATRDDVSTISGATPTASDAVSHVAFPTQNLGGWAGRDIVVPDDAPDDHLTDPQWGSLPPGLQPPSSVVSAVQLDAAQAIQQGKIVPYIRQGWNVLDFVVVCGGIFNVLFPSAGASISGLKALRALRVVKAFRFLRSLQFILVALYRSIIYLLNVFVILWFFFVFFGLVGIQVYGGSLRRRCVMPQGIAESLTDEAADVAAWHHPAPDGFVQYSPETWCSPVDDPKDFLCGGLDKPALNLTCVDVGENPFGGLVGFDNIGLAGLTTFIVASLEGWTDIMYITQDSELTVSWLYFVLLVIVINFGGINTFTSVVCSEFVDTSRDLARKKLRERTPESYGLNRPGAAKNSSRGQWLRDMFESNKRQSRQMRASAESAASQLSRPSRPSRDSHTSNGTEEEVAVVTGLGAVSSEVQKFHPDADAVEAKGQQQEPVHPNSPDSSVTLDGTTATDEPRGCFGQPRSSCYRAWGPCRRSLSPLVANPWFDRIIIGCIVLNSIALALEHHDMEDELRYVLDVTEYVFAAVFLVEMVLKLITCGGLCGYLSVSQNVFDGAIVMTSIVSLMQPIFVDESSADSGSASLSAVSALRVFRLFRVFRIARLLHKVRGLKELLDTVLYSVNAVLSVTFFIAFTGVCGAIILTQLFGRPRAPDGVVLGGVDDIDPRTGFGRYSGSPSPRLNFDTFGDSLLTVFVVFSGEEWVSVMLFANWLKGAMCFVVVLAFAFGNFVALSLFVAVIVENFETAEYARQKKQQLHYEVLRRRFRLNYQQAVNDVLNGQDPALALRMAYDKQEQAAAAKSRLAEPVSRSPERAPSAADVPRNSASDESDGLLPGAVSPLADGPSEERIHVRELSRKVTGDMHRMLSKKDLEILRVTDKDPLADRVVDAELDSSSSDDDDDYVDRKIFHSGVGPHNGLDPALHHISKLMGVASGPQVVRASAKYHAAQARAPRASRFDAKAGSRSSDGAVRGQLSTDVSSDGDLSLNRGERRRSVSGALQHALAKTPIGRAMRRHNKKRELAKLKAEVLRGERPITDLPVVIGTRTEAQLLHGLAKAESRRDRLRGTACGLCSPMSRLRLFCFNLVEHKQFENLIILAIAVSSVFLAVETKENRGETVFFVADIVFLVVFTVEAAAKCVAYGVLLNGPGSYLRDGWNILDATVLVASLGSTVATALGLDGGSSVRILRLGRTLRPLRVVQRSPSMRVVVDAVIKGGGPLLQVVALVLFIVAIFAILGVNLFAGQLYRCNNPAAVDKASCSGYFLDDRGRNTSAVWANPTYGDLEGLPPFHFDDFGASMHVVLDIMTREGYVDVLAAGMDATGVDQAPVRNASPGNSIFFIACMCIVSFFGAELFTGVIIENYRVSDGTAFMTESQRRWAEAKVQLSQKKAPRPLRPLSSNGCVRWCQQATRHPKFEPFIMCMIGLNLVLLLMAHDPMDDEFSLALDIANASLLFVFTIEMLVKNLALTPRVYWRNPGDVFDGVLVTGSLLMLVEHFLPIRLPAAAQLARGLRMGRLLRLVRAFRQLRLLANAMRRSVAAMLNVTALLLLTLFVGAVISVDLFGDLPLREGTLGITRRANFQSFPTAMLLLFRMLTGEGINIIIRECQLAAPTAPYFLFFFYAIGRFVFLNLYLAFILDNFISAVRVDNSTLGKLGGQLRAFKKLWRKFDPQCTGFLDITDLPKFLRQLGPPLGGPHEPLAWDSWFNRVRVDCDLVCTSTGVPYKSLLMLLPSLVQPEAALSVAERVRNEVLQEYAKLTRAALVIQALMRRGNVKKLLNQRLRKRLQEARERIRLRREGESADNDGTSVSAVHDGSQAKRSADHLLTGDDPVLDLYADATLAHGGAGGATGSTDMPLLDPEGGPLPADARPMTSAARPMQMGGVARTGMLPPLDGDVRARTAPANSTSQGTRSSRESGAERGGESDAFPMASDEERTGITGQGEM